MSGKALQNLKALKVLAAGERVTFRARVLRFWEAGGLRMCLVGDASALTRVEIGEVRVQEDENYQFRNAVIRGAGTVHRWTNGAPLCRSTTMSPFRKMRSTLSARSRSCPAYNGRGGGKPDGYRPGGIRHRKTETANDGYSSLMLARTRSINSGVTSTRPWTFACSWAFLMSSYSVSPRTT